jgi:MFS family permease
MVEAKANRLQKWHALAATYLGECFDAMDATIYFIALVPAMSELLKTKDATTIGFYGSIVLAVFMVGWALGSVLFGMVSDRFGRVKTMMWTILLYAGASGLCALAHNWQELAICRFFVGLGIGGEVSIGCVLLGEAWSGDRAKKLWAMSFMQTSFGVGCILTGLFNLGSGEFGWRYLFLVGIVPALITFYNKEKSQRTSQRRNNAGETKKGRSSQCRQEFLDNGVDWRKSQTHYYLHVNGRLSNRWILGWGVVDSRLDQSTYWCTGC